MSTKHVAMVVKAAREMARLHAEACNVNEQDLWIVNGPEFLEEAEKVLAAVGAPDLLATLLEIATMPVESNEWDAVEKYDAAKALARAAIAKATA